jgi:anti-anti-sigma factor
MGENPEIKALSHSSLDGEATATTGDWDRAASPSIVRDGLPHLKVRGVAGFKVVDIVNTDVLFEEGAIRELSTQLNCLVEEGCTRLLLNLGGIQYLSSDVLATLAGLHLRVERAQGRLGLCGLDPVLRDMVRICGLERVFDIYADEREVLDGGLAADDRPGPERSRPPYPGVNIAPNTLP